MILATATGDRAPEFTWYALVATRTGYARLNNGPDAYTTSEYTLLVAPGDAIAWDNGDGDETVMPDEIRLVAKQVVQ